MKVIICGAEDNVENSEKGEVDHVVDVDDDQIDDWGNDVVAVVDE